MPEPEVNPKLEKWLDLICGYFHLLNEEDFSGKVIVNFHDGGISRITPRPAGVELDELRKELQKKTKLMGLDNSEN